MIVHASSQKVLAREDEWLETSVARARGLLKYDSPRESFAAIFALPLFGFFPLVHTFGMKFSIDILFCDRHSKVVGKFLNIRPGRFVLPVRYLFGGCRYLIEFTKSDLSAVNVGDVLEFRRGDS